MNNVIIPNELYHHGILGMKWGVRRYQNPDGSYTSAGKARRRNSDGSLTPEGRAHYEKDRTNLRKASDIATVTSAATGLGASGLSGYKSLNNTNISESERIRKASGQAMNMVNSSRTINSVVNRERIREGTDYINDVLSIVGSTLATTASALIIIKTIKELKG